MPRLLVTGGRGQLGVALSRYADTPGRDDLDLTEPASIAAALEAYTPEVVINAAAYTDVDGAESDEAGARAINSDGAQSLAVACRDRGIRLIHISTDYVFSGEVPRGGDPATAPGFEPHDPTGPTTAYGRTKLAGERAVLTAYPEATIIRTAWLYTGPWRVILDQPGGDFVATMIRLESERETVNVVNDQWGSPTYVGSMADQLLGLLSAEKAGSVDARGRTLHLAGGGRATWFELARAVFEFLGADPERVQPCTSEEFPRPAPRPEFSVLSDRSWRDLGLDPLGEWREDLGPGLTYLASSRNQSSRGSARDRDA
ncbi:dTDP-4-dehydrorhamnose reductase [Rhodococcus sp. IEGM 1408]|uniref:dTDP-4-dehydrorhamnose reductase n=1 Tax=Rhodococcus sp. IEGM 1408 TaxID=3082220 RepID=UPI002954B37A|nr:dTDP-4-dehydrorhamnose reductase [Rhodococcus sp. IEGM 1408]MDV8001352.1 dTDP-4-dehydrorhamnose reductase [Rhodococcus sp. IEGM 1408]